MFSGAGGDDNSRQLTDGGGFEDEEWLPLSQVTGRRRCKKMNADALWELRAGCLSLRRQLSCWE